MRDKAMNGKTKEDAMTCFPDYNSFANSENKIEYNNSSKQERTELHCHTKMEVNLLKNYPIYPEVDYKLQGLCYKKAYELYGRKLPVEVMSRIENELNAIKENGYSSLYMIARELVEKSNEAGYMVGARGCSGASIVSFLLGITEVNPFPPHYICHGCGYTDFEIRDIKTFCAGDVGIDLPDRKCPICGMKLCKDGYDIPIETFLGKEFNKEPDFDLIFAGEYQSEAVHELKKIDGIGAVCRPGTLNTIQYRKATKCTKKHFKDNKIATESGAISEISEKLVGARQGDAINPSAVIIVPVGTDISEYTPIIKGKHDDVPSAQIENHNLEGSLLKLDILEHNMFSIMKYLQDKTGVNPIDIPLEDKRIMSLFSDISELGVDTRMLPDVNVGTLGDPEFGCGFARRIIEKICPKRFSDIMRIFGMLHGTGALIDSSGQLLGDNLDHFPHGIACRDDIMLQLMYRGIDREDAFRIMEYVRTGRTQYGLKKDWIEKMSKAGIPHWYIQSCEKIRYLLPRAHCAYYTLMSWRLLYYKLYYPEAFYDAWVNYGATKITIKHIQKGYDYLRDKYEKQPFRDKEIYKYEHDKRDQLLVAMEMYARGVCLV